MPALPRFCFVVFQLFMKRICKDSGRYLHTCNTN